MTTEVPVPGDHSTTPAFGGFLLKSNLMMDSTQNGTAFTVLVIFQLLHSEQQFEATIAFM